MPKFSDESKADQHFAGLKDFTDAARRWRDAGYIPIPLYENAEKKLLPTGEWKELNVVTDAQIAERFTKCAGIAHPSGKSGRRKSPSSVATEVTRFAIPR